jgi:exosortase
MTQTLGEPGRIIRLPFLAALGAALVALGWAFWPTLAEAAHCWAHDPLYSHGWLVPGFAVLLLWMRRGRLAEGLVEPNWWGAALLAGGIAVRLVGGFYYFVYLDSVSLIPCLAGVFLLLGGWTAWRWAWPALAFLVFMLPLPHRVAVSMAEPLQNFATITSTFTLQTLGFPALAEGNVILLNDVEIGIVEACSGLRMLVIFFALSTGVALLIHRALWEKLVLVASALPIALVVNILRITATGICYDQVGKPWTDAVFHDLAGWLMMPLALVLLGVELVVLRRLFLASPGGPAPARMPFGLRPPRPDRGTQRPAGPHAPPRRRPARTAARPFAKP